MVISNSMMGVLVSLCSLILLLTEMAETQDSVSKEYCFPDIFNATCGPHDVILLESARYGRMGPGRCLGTSASDVGCWTDVLDQLDRRCSGRHNCVVAIPDGTLHQLQPCPKDMLSYMEAAYKCLPITINPDWSCQSHTTLTVSGTSGYLSSMATLETGLGSRICPWTIQVNPGQRINITLLDFGVATRLTKSGSTCQVYAKIREQGMASEITICGGQKRERGVYISETDQIQILMLTSLDDRDPVYFTLKYNVVGCTDPAVPKGAWLKRTGEKAVIGCNFTTQAWHIVCHGNDWFGKIENCTLGATKSQSNGLAASKGLMVAVITGLILGVLIGVALLFFVIMVHKRKQQNRRSNTTNISLRTGEMESVQGTPFLRDAKTNKPAESMDSGYGYTHVCDVTIYQPYQQRQGTTFQKDNITEDQYHSQGRDLQQGQGRDLQQGQEQICPPPPHSTHYVRPGYRKPSFSGVREERYCPDFDLVDHTMNSPAHRVLYPVDNNSNCPTDH